ncbi:hypothetical protein ZOSMA_324G00220 [Zostera marina]|uniref:Myb-like domain-containing protein n=1 Tax=Zostera marina TaxID=29655 RepID=A0A0K9P8J1_ZOSMR|nr:hypothetical protein ZOSMA_324G00220 [Zostera marina]
MSSATSPELLKLVWRWAIEALADSKKMRTSFLKELIEQNLGGLEDSNVRENVSLRNLEELVESDGLKSSSKVDSSLIFRILENYNEKIKVDPQSEDVISRSIQQLKDSVDKTCVKSVSSLMGILHGLSQEIQLNHLLNLIDNRLNHRGDVPSSNISPRAEVHSANLHGLNQCKNNSACIVNDSTLSYGFKDKQSLGELQNGDKKHIQCKLNQTSLIRKHGLSEKNQPGHLHDLDDVNRLKKISSCSDKVASSTILHDVSSPNIPPRAEVHSAHLHDLNQCRKDSVCIVYDSNSSHIFTGKESLGEQQNGNKKNTHPSLIPIISSGYEDNEESIKKQGEHENEKIIHNSLKEEATEAFFKDKLVTSQIPNDDTQQQMCIKCSTSDHLLVCCGDCCPIAIHESCFGPPLSFDEDTREFYCPFCSYIKAAKAYRNAKKKVYRCKEYLSSFMTVLNEVPSMKPVHSVSQKRSSSSDGDIEDHYHIQERMKRNKANAMKETGHNTTREHAMNSSKILDQKEKDESVILKDINASTCNGIAKSGDGVSHDIQVTKERHEAIERSNASKQHLFEKNATRMNESKDQMPPSSAINCFDFFKESKDQMPSSSAIDQEVQIPTQDNNSEIYRKLRKKPMKRHAIFQYPYCRRSRLAWTEEEEEILKVAVEKLSNGKIKYPWVEILHYGRDVFHKTHPIDLKDKWRNMQKKM